MSSYDWAANRVRWAKLFVSPLKKIVRKLGPSNSFSIADGALTMLDERIYNILAHLCSVRGSFPTTRPAAEDAVERLFPESVAEWTLEACRAAVAARSSSSSSRRKSELRRFFPTDKVHAILNKEVARDIDVPVEVTIVLVTALEELAFELLKFAVSFAQQLNESSISQETLNVTMEARMDLSAITNKCVSPPSVQAYIRLSYSEAVREFLVAENNFVAHVDAVSKVFMDTLESQFEVAEATINEVFFNLGDLVEIAQNLATDVEDVLDKGNIHKSLPVVGETLLNFTETKEYENFVSFAVHLPSALKALHNLTYDQAMFSKMWDFSPEFALATKYDLPAMLMEPLYHLKHYAEALASIMDKAAKSHDHFVRRSVPLLQDALSILKPAAASISPDKYPTLEERETYLAFPSMEARVSHAHFARLHNTIDGVQEIELYKSRYNLLHRGPVVLDDKAQYMFALEHVLILCKENSTKKSYRFKMKTAISTKDIHIAMDQCCSDSLVIVFTAQGKTMRLKASDKDAYEAWLCALARIVSRGYVERTVRQKLEDFEQKLPALTPDPTNYPFSEPDSPRNIRLDMGKGGGERTAPLVKGGTLVKLIERLTHPQHVDLQYVTQFLLTYRMFCEPTELLDLLLLRYDVPPPKDLEGRSHLLKRFTKRYANPVKLRVLNVLKQWVDKHFYDFETSKSLMRQLLQFIQREVRSDAQRERQCQAVIRVIKNHRAKKARDQDNSEHTTPPPLHLWLPVIPGRIHMVTLHPLEVARQLTIVDSGLYRAIQPSELVGQQWNKEDKETKSPHVLAFIRHFNRISRWVIRTILEMSDVEERQLVLQSFLEVLFELRELNNFNSLMAIKEALRNSAISRLKHTWAAIPERKMALFSSIEDEVGGSNHANLRSTISQASPPCIPFLGLYLTDITFMEDGSPDYLPLDPDDTAKDVTGSDIINFSKRRLVGETCMTIQQFQNRTYNLSSEPTIQDFLSRLPPVHEDAHHLPDGSKASIQKFEDVMYDLSLKLEPRGSSSATPGEKLFNDPKDFKVCRDAIVRPRDSRSSMSYGPGEANEQSKGRTRSLRAVSLGGGSTSSPRDLTVHEEAASPMETEVSHTDA